MALIPVNCWKKGIRSAITTCGRLRLWRMLRKGCFTCKQNSNQLATADAAQKHHRNGSIGVMEGNTFNRHTTSSTEEESKLSSTILFSMDVRIWEEKLEVVMMMMEEECTCTNLVSNFTGFKHVFILSSDIFSPSDLDKNGSPLFKMSSFDQAIGCFRANQTSQCEKEGRHSS